MQLPSLRNISNKSLLDNLKNLKINEDNTLADILLHLHEIDSRGIYRDIGFSSLFSYCREALGYSEGASFRRIQAARCLKDSPEIYDLIKYGKLTLCAVGEISKVIKPENKEELLLSAQGKPKLEVQKIVASHLPAKTALKREKITIRKVRVDSNPNLFENSDNKELNKEFTATVAVEVDQDFMKLLEEAKTIVGPAPLVEVLRRTLKEFVLRRKAAPRTIKDVKISSSTRYIPKSVAYAVRQRDEYRCTYISPDGRRCCEKCGLQIDHIRPFALGGTNEVSNLRLLCQTHNRFLAEKIFGKEKIQSYINP